MNIIEAPVQEELVQPATSNENEGGTDAVGDGPAGDVQGGVDQKPSRKALLAARMKEVEVSSPSDEIEYGG
jgi:hypothetical protein